LSGDFVPAPAANIPPGSIAAPVKAIYGGAVFFVATGT
jgi:hypothetical protein